MIRSLYLRVVLTFIASVILGLTVAFFTMMWVYKDTFNTMLSRQFSDASHDLAGVLKRVNPDEWDSMLREQRWTTMSLQVMIVDPTGKTIYSGMKHSGKAIIPPEAVDKVRSGGDYSNKEPSAQHRIYGTPIFTERGTYAVFIQSIQQEAPFDLVRMLFTTLLVALGSGSLFILVSARYLVNPLKKMTLATRQIAKGDFNIQLNQRKRKDELGELARSFDHMALELHQLESMRQDFVSNVSHEIQSPLTSISGFSKLVRNPQMPEEEKQQYLDIIETEAERLSRLSENLLKLASLDSEHHPFHPGPLELDEQLRRVVVALEPLWSAKSIELQLELPRTKLIADVDQLNQVWINLLTNAIKFTPAGGSIELSLETMTDRVRVIIQDTGAGIAPEDQERIFERFYKGDKSRERAKSGSGLGLAIVRKIVDLHQGTVEVESELGRGTKMAVTLPSVWTPAPKP
ncbi:HAMP domain-containing sensor histidine kinase [Paenibacillus filicis]|uniref:Heme sensor protein HssS n=1 Tax=Paenibacillus filicis TaxID=669464 RepID=A0ABU9DL27_9BACL